MGPLPIDPPEPVRSCALTPFEGLAWLFGGLLGATVLDRFLLWCEARGWVYYRRSKPARGAATYHILEMSSIFNPSHRVAQEVLVQEEEQEDEAGDPVGSQHDPGSSESTHSQGSVGR